MTLKESIKIRSLRQDSDVNEKILDFWDFCLKLVQGHISDVPKPIIYFKKKGGGRGSRM